MQTAQAEATEKPELSVEIEEEQNTVAEEVSTKEEEKEAQPVEQQDTEELENYSEGVQKRISKLTAKMREAERREKAALDYAQGVKKQLEEQNQKQTKSDNDFITEFETRLKYQDEALKTKLKEAIDRGDLDMQVEVQKSLAQLAQDNERLNYVKKKQEEAPAETEATPADPAQPQSQQIVPPQPQQMDPAAAAWAEKNTWFGQDEPMTLVAFSIHNNMVEKEGWTGKEPSYYEELDKRIRAEFPHKFEQKPNGRSAPPVGGANRGNQRGGPQKVRLTQSEVAIARKLGISNEEYAKQKLLLQDT